jgi:hypothetical protein
LGKKHLREDVATFEDKEWTVRVLKEGYAIDFVESILVMKSQEVHATFRFKNDVVGNYQLWQGHLH